MRWARFFLGFAIVFSFACTGSREEPRRTAADEPVFALNKAPDSNIGMLPIPFAPPPDGDKIYAQSLGPASLRALITGRPGSVVDGVTEVCARNKRSGSQACFPVRNRPDGTSFSGLLSDTLPDDIIQIWGNGPLFSRGGPGINSIEKRVQLFTTKFPAAPSAAARVHSADPERNGIYIADRGVGLYFVREMDFDRPLEEIMPSLFKKGAGQHLSEISALEADGPDRLWIVNRNSLLLLTFSGAQAVFSDLSSLLPDDGVASMRRTGHGRIWLGVRGGVVQLTLADSGIATRTFRHDPSDPSSFPSAHYVVDLDAGEQNDLWAATYDGLIHISWLEGAPRYRRYGREDGIAVGLLSVAADRSGGAWVTGGNLLERNLYRVNADQQRVEALPYLPFGGFSRDGNGGIWFGDGATGTVAHFSAAARGHEMRFFSLPVGGPDFETFTVFLSDLPDEIWVGSNAANGIQRLRISGDTVSPRRFHEADHVLPGNDIVSVTSDGSTGAWVATAGNGVSRIEWVDGYARFLNVSSRHGLSSNKVTAILSRSAEEAWVSTDPGGLALLKVRDGRVTVRTYTAQEGIRSPWITSLAFDGDRDAIWIGHAVTGVSLARFDAQRNLSVRNFGMLDGLTSNKIAKVASDHFGGAWILTQYDSDRAPHGATLCHLVFRDDRPLISNYSTENGLASRFLYDISADRAGAVWIANSADLLRLEERDGIPIWTRYPLVASTVSADGQNGLWFSRNLTEGLHHLFADSGSIESYAFHEWFSGQRATAMVPLSSGEIWVGTAGSGLFFFSLP